MGETGYHRLVVVDEHDRPVGIISSLDVIRGLVGLPASHPSVFPHLDKATGVQWTDDIVLELDRVEAAPDGPGVLVLVYGGAGLRERVVWAESTNNVRTRLIDMLSTPQDHVPVVKYWLGRGHLRFRASSLPEPELRDLVVSRVREHPVH
jgi:CBS domain-containing protein